MYRVSTGKQVDYDSNNEADIPMQRKACHKFASEMGWEIVYEEQEMVFQVIRYEQKTVIKSKL